MASSVSKRVESALEEKPFLLEALSQGYANLSAVARVLQKQVGGSEEAVRAAVKRFSASRLRQRRADEKKVLEVLSHSRLSLSTKVNVLVVERTPETEAKAASFSEKTRALVKEESGMTLVVDAAYFRESQKLFSRSEILTVNEDLVVLTLISSPVVEAVPGVVAFLTAQMARHNINLKEFWSSYTDTLFFVEKKDASKAYEVLSALL
ncbi:ACT domain-containing protein [Candidatus Micrarchaeota archaeon]|nr:ACT domain-containing protein [Candidatus Micrarchaeota archaeon]